MNRIINLGLSLIFFTVSLNSFGQDDMDAFRFSQIHYEGTARFMGAGGAFGAIGADFSALNVNPAAIGIFKKNEISFTPFTLSISNNSSIYNKEEMNYPNLRYNLNNFGLVFAFSLNENSVWKYIQLGIGYNRIMNYNSSFRVSGHSNGSTIGEAFANEANGHTFQTMSNDAYFAYLAYMFDPVSEGATQYHPLFKDYNFLQTTNVKRTKANDEMIFSIGSNYNDNVYIGATIGIPFVKFQENRFYSESDEDDETPNFHYFSAKDMLKVSGTGINLKLGIIYQPADFVRLGLAFHTPTYYEKMKDYFERELYAEFTDNYGDTTITLNYSNSYKYSLITPLRATFSTAFIIKKRAFISAEYEFVDYRQANMIAIDDDYSFTNENKAIQNKYGISHILRAGFEVALNENLMVRAGYNYKSSPYQSEINNMPFHSGSLGLGIRAKHNFFFDFAYILSWSKEKYWFYDPTLVNHVDLTYLSHKVAFTFGKKF